MLFVVSCVLVLLVALLVGLWSTDANHPIRYNPDIKGPVLLVFAHPDDEAMFFTPLLQYMRRVNIQVSLLCLTTGDAVGLGNVREKELVRSAAYYGIPANRVTTLNVPQFRDGMKERWDADKVAQSIQHHLASSSSSSSSGGSSSYFQTILTFDASGVSSHPNHISTYQGVRLLAQKERLSEFPTVQFFMLRTHSLGIKYGGLMSLWGMLLWGPEGRLVTGGEGRKGNSNINKEVTSATTSALGEGPMGEVLGKSERKYQKMQAQHDRYRTKERSALVVLIRPSQVLSSLTAMMEHKSQLVWFRYAFVFLSSYTYFNVIEELH